MGWGKKLGGGGAKAQICLLQGQGEGTEVQDERWSWGTEMMQVLCRLLRRGGEKEWKRRRSKRRDVLETRP